AAVVLEAVPPILIGLGQPEGPRIKSPGPAVRAPRGRGGVPSGPTHPADGRTSLRVRCERGSSGGLSVSVQKRTDTFLVSKNLVGGKDVKVGVELLGEHLPHGAPPDAEHSSAPAPLRVGIVGPPEHDDRTRILLETGGIDAPNVEIFTLTSAGRRLQVRA